MKNLKVLKSPQEINDFIYNLWATDEFKQSHKEKDGYINKLVEKFSAYPRFFAEMTDQTVEWAQFYSYFNILIHRSYFNKTIQDLYYLHEIIHISTMLYSKDLDFNFWKSKMIDNEMCASVESEVLVYNQLSIRNKSFNFEIWADTLPKELLDNRENLIQHRLDRMKHPTNKVELTLNKYYTNNQVWAEIWKSRYNQVEIALSNFYQKCLTDNNEAVECLKNFIEHNLDKEVLFRKEAEEFSKIYLNNY